METRKKTQDQFIELKEATVTDLINLQSQVTKATAAQEQTLLKKIESHINSEQHARQTVQTELETRVIARLEQWRHASSEGLADLDARLQVRLLRHPDGSWKESSRQHSHTIDAFKSEVQVMLTKQTALHESTAGTISNLEQHLNQELSQGTTGLSVGNSR